MTAPSTSSYYYNDSQQQYPPGSEPYSNEDPYSNDQDAESVSSFVTAHSTTGAYTTGTDTTGAYPSGAYPTGVYPTGAYTRGSNTTGAYPTGAYTTGAYTTSTDTTGAYPTINYSHGQESLREPVAQPTAASYSTPGDTHFSYPPAAATGSETDLQLVTVHSRATMETIAHAQAAQAAVHQEGRAAASGRFGHAATSAYSTVATAASNVYKKYPVKSAAVTAFGTGAAIGTTVHAVYSGSVDGGEIASLVGAYGVAAVGAACIVPEYRERRRQRESQV